MKFFNKLDEDLKAGYIAGSMICIQIDANSKLGSNFIPNDPHDITWGWGCGLGLRLRP